MYHHCRQHSPIRHTPYHSTAHVCNHCAPRLLDASHGVQVQHQQRRGMGRARQQQEHEQQPSETNQASATGSATHAIRAYTFSDTCSYNAFVAWLLDWLEAPSSASCVAKGQVRCTEPCAIAYVGGLPQAASKSHTNAMDNDHTGDKMRYRKLPHYSPRCTS
jgi:hypothetical protein